MKIWCLDFETFFSSDYTLKSLTTEAYIRDPRFEALMLAVRDPDGNKFWVPREGIPTFLASVDWSQHAILCHHAQFDGLIFSHHYGVRPRLWLDTLSMARLVHGNHLSVALGSLAHHYGLQEKSVPYEAFKGKRWHEIDEGLRQLLGAGACDDVDLTWTIFQELAKVFPIEEYAVVDATIRMFTEPVLVGDAEALAKIQHDEIERKYKLLNALGVNEKDLQSATKFVALLEELGVEVEYKDGKNGPIPAIAATDDFMKGLENDSDETISLLAQARLEVKSTLNETRAGRIYGMSTRGALTTYLSYCGAHTTRWSGGDRCLAGDVKVVVFDFQKGLLTKCLIDILPDDLVWDGEEFVAHDGVIFQGFKEVITHDGITGTPDHKVFTDGGGITTLEIAAARKIKLERARKPAPEQIPGGGTGAHARSSGGKAKVPKQK